MFLLIVSLAEIIHIGQLKLQNGREIFSSKPQLLSSNEDGWYYINIINSSGIDFLTKYGVSISTKSLMNPQWVCAYLNTKQIELISQFYYITEVLPSDKIVDESHLLESSKFLVYSHDPPQNGRFQRIYKNYYLTDTYTSQLLEDKSILQISPYSPPKLFNRFSRGSIQQDKFKVEFNDLLLIPDLPMYKHDIRGTGQVVTVIDSGLDYRSCFFKDNSIPPPVNVTSFTHRKLIRYEPFADDSDASHGHGTHTSGTVAGKADCSQCNDCNDLSDCAVSLYDGHAPDARLYFIDAGYVSKPSDLDAPYDLGYVINTSRSFGCHIFSCSWGYTPTNNDAVRVMYDEIGYDNDDIIFFFGAGNSRVKFDTYAPANSKNIIGVGGVDQPEATSVFSGTNNYIYLETRQKNKNDSFLCDFSENFNKFVERTTNDPLSNFTDQIIGEKFVVIEKEEDCPDEASQFNASLYITVNNSFKCKAFEKVPRCYLKSGNVLNGTIASLVPHFVSENNGPTYGVSTFTTLGPSITGLVKPDILAPGKEITSAAGNTLSSYPPGCSIGGGTRTKSGTSMATPGAAGSTALLAQYLKDGFYPSGKRTVDWPSWPNTQFKGGDSIVPSMPLLKALISNGAGPIKSSSRIPDSNKGFGAMHVSDCLVFADEIEKAERFGLRISPQDFTIGSGEEFVADIVLLEKGQNEGQRKPFVTSLTWLDPPTNGELNVPVYADLDLFVESPDGRIFYGNQIDEDNEEAYSTTERVTITDAVGGRYRIHVKCPKLTMKVKILPSVVVNGPFKHFDFNINNKFLEFRKVENDRSCPFNKTGHFCQHDVTEVKLGQRFEFSLRHRLPKYLCTYFEGGELKITFSKGSGSKLENVFISANQVHKFGGDLLYFSKPSSEQSFVISETTVQPGTYIYITAIELVNNDVNHVQIQVTKVSKPTNSPSQSQINSPSQSEYISPSQSEYISPSQSEYISPSQSEYISPSQSEFISPSQSEFISPSQSEFISPVQTDQSKSDDDNDGQFIPTAQMPIPTKNTQKSTEFKKKFRKVSLFTLLVYVVVTLFVYFRCEPTNPNGPIELDENTSNHENNQALEALLAQRNDVL